MQNDISHNIQVNMTQLPLSWSWENELAS